MSEGYNSCEFIGHVGQDPELRFTQSGQAVMNINIACGERYRKDDQIQEKTEWVPLVVWGKRAEGLAKVLNKGSRIHAVGRFTTRKWEDKKGVTRYSSEVNCNRVLLLSTKGRQVDEAPEHTDSDAPADQT